MLVHRYIFFCLSAEYIFTGFSDLPTRPVPLDTRKMHKHENAARPSLGLRGPGYRMPMLLMQQAVAQETGEITLKNTSVPAMTTTQEDTSKTARKIQCPPIPVVAVNPAAGLSGSKLMGINWNMADPSDTRTSAFLVSSWINSRSQIFAALGGNAFSRSPA